MKNKCNQRLILAFLVVIFAFIYACSGDTQNNQSALTSTHQTDSLNDDELNYPIAHQHLAFKQRPTIRPVYQEIEKNNLAEHDGFMLNVNLVNNAKKTTYKDIEIEIAYFDKDKKSAGSEKFLIKPALKPGQSLVESFKIKQYKNTAYGVKLIAAKGTQ